MSKYTSAVLANMIEKKLSHNFGVTPDQASDELFYKAAVLSVLDIMRERRSNFKKEVAEKEAKTVYYLSMEFVMGRSLKNNLYNLMIIISDVKIINFANRFYNVFLKHLDRLTRHITLFNFAQIVKALFNLIKKSVNKRYRVCRHFFITEIFGKIHNTAHQKIKALLNTVIYA